MLKVKIIYSTIGGNTELAVRRAEVEFKKLNYDVVSKRVDIASTNDLDDLDLVILASPTYGQGSLEAHFLPFLKQMKSRDNSKTNFAVIGLGDNKYYPEYLTEAAGLLEDEVRNLKGNLVVPSLRIGMPPLKFIDKLVPSWVNKIDSYFQSVK